MFYFANIYEGTLNPAGETLPSVSPGQGIVAVEVDRTPTEDETNGIIAKLRTHFLGAPVPTLNDSQTENKRLREKLKMAMDKYIKANGSMVGYAKATGITAAVISAIQGDRPLPTPILEKAVGKLSDGGGLG